MSNWLGTMLRPSLFRRLLWVQLLLATLAWMVFVFLTWSQVYVQGEGYLDRDLHLIAQSMTRLSQDKETTEALTRRLDLIAQLNIEFSEPKLSMNEFTYALWHADGRLLAVNSHPSNPTLWWPPERIGLGGRMEQQDWIAYGSSSPDGSLFAVVAYSRPAIQRFERTLVADSLFAGATVLLLLWLMLWLSTTWGMRPLRALAKELGFRRVDDLSPVHTIQPYVELRPLLHALNGKMTDLSDLLKRERRFYADAAHELRTPLAALEAQAYWVAHSNESQERHTALAALEHGVQRCARTLDKLLTLARLEGQTSQHESVDLAACLRDKVGQFAPRAIVSGTRLAYSGPKSLVVVADLDQICCAVDCLIDNSLRHTLSGSEITVEAGLEVDAWFFRVIDNGPGIALEDRQRVFDRFVRLSESSIGSGLGLSIVREMARRHGGTAEVSDARAGCCVTVRVPLE